MSGEIKCELGAISFDFHTDDHIDPPYSHAFVWGFNGLFLYYVLQSLLSASKSKRSAREADSAFDPNAPLTPGNRFISGRVEYASGQKNAVSVHVEQHGTETKSKNGWSHQWKELDRKIEAQPFYVVRMNGERVRVEPGDKPLLVDKPDETKWIQRELRIRTARLTEGEEVIVQGSLSKSHDPELQEGGGYRGTGQGWILKPIRNQRMEVSAEKLGDRHRKRAKAFYSTVAAMFWVIGFFNLFCLFYQMRFFGGEDTCALVTNKDIKYSIDSKGRRTTYYKVYVNVDAPGAPRLDGDLTYSDWEHVERGSILAFHYVPNHPDKSMPGTSTSLSILSVIFSSFVGLVGFAVYTGTRDYRRWYEGKLEDSGSGRLPEFPPGSGQPAE